MNTILFIFILSVTTVESHLILKKGEIGLALHWANPSLFIKAVFISPYVPFWLALQGTNFLFRVVVISRVNRGYTSRKRNKIFARIQDGLGY